ncbi:hypothetical protein MPSEU_000785700 [Mayamaea pseudoterrestris]|nr:hypothetical protein MPSEU_000785700 [Mayamaea pseudoterrestris]
MSTPSQAPCFDLLPPGGTPWSKLLSCCVPSAQPKSFAATTKPAAVPVANPSPTTTLKTDITKTIDHTDLKPSAEEDSMASDESSLEGSVDFDTVKPQTNALSELLRLLLSLLFLRFLTQWSDKKRIKANGETNGARVSA